MIRTTISLFVLDFLALAGKFEQLRRFMSYFPFANYYIYNVMFVHDAYQEVRVKVGQQA